MKIVAFLVMLILSFLMFLGLSGCASYANNGKTACQRNAILKGHYWMSKGMDVRYGHGFYKGKGHMWCERRISGDLWVLCRDTVSENNVNEPIENSPKYTVVWYGEPIDYGSTSS